MLGLGKTPDITAPKTRIERSNAGSRLSKFLAGAATPASIVDALNALAGNPQGGARELC